MTVTDAGCGNISTTQNSNTVTDLGSAKIYKTESSNTGYILYDDRITDYSLRKRSHSGSDYKGTEKNIKERWDSEGRDQSSCYKRQCRVCGFIFYAFSPLALYCSSRCKNDAWIERRKIYKTQEKERICKLCHTPFTAKRKDTLYCSAACKQKAFRIAEIRKFAERTAEREISDRILSEYDSQVMGGLS